MLKKILRLPLHYQILLGMTAGLACGYFIPEAIPYISPIGTIFIKLLKMIVVPLIFVSILDGIARIGDFNRLSDIGFKAFVFYLATNCFAVLTSLILVNWIKPGVGVDIFGKVVPAEAGSPIDLQIIPSNIFQALAQGDALQIIFVAIFLGLGLVKVYSQVPTLIAFIDQINQLFMKLTQGIILFAPLGVFGLMAPMTHAIDWQTFAGVGKFALVIILGLIIHGGMTLPLLFKAFSRRPLGKFVNQMQPALLSAFSTSSSSATLPLTFKCVEEKAGISRQITGFVLPVGATMNMDGTAIYEAAACLFVAQAVGVELNLIQQIVVFVTASLAAVGAASIPSAGLVTLAMVLKAVHLPLDGIAFLFAIDRPLDMSRTIVNVWGDMVACAVVEGSTKNLKNTS